ncbi:296R [Invertebrate iridescent virus Kaz2018]|uniref:296R n=1 Tax=Invertebrate iridescent virus 6 TaxID=176652 RepID=Q91FM8_IIV6|nr:296R [Invertebrate iridescent virus 6]AAK82157.1 296R [Invertebrate iridescent virus 6]QMS79597.1 hypothetical protein IIV6-T1_290 [Invertebrate iridescent virus 6]QNH08706.1 296R [Invertebrate iridescent virus Kaz2018]
MLKKSFHLQYHHLKKILAHQKVEGYLIAILLVLFQKQILKMYLVHKL